MRRRALPRLRALILWVAVAPVAVLLTGCFSSPPQIVALVPAAGSTQLGATTPVEVVFDQPVVRASVASHFGICALKSGRCIAGLPGCPNLAAAFSAPPDAPCRVRWLSSPPRFIFYHPRALFAPNTKYQFTLAAGIASSGGTLNSLDHTWDLTSAAAPVLTGSTPGNGATGVARDTALTLSFSRAMSRAAVATAVRLTPAGDGLRVFANGSDPSTFEVIPDQPLDPGTAYTLRISRRATDAQGQPISAALAIHFTTGAFSAGAHSLVLAGPPGAAASVVLLGQLSAPTGGEPIPAEVVFRAPLCDVAHGCGRVGMGRPTEALTQAALSPGAHWLAVVGTGLTTPGPAGPILDIVDLSTGQVQLRLSGARWPAWSPDGSTVAFVAGGAQVELYRPASGSLSALSTSAPASGPVVWTGAGDALAVPVGPSDTGARGVELVAPTLGARYPLPGVRGEVLRIVAAPTGEEMAVEVASSSSSGGSVTWVTDPSTGRPPQRVGVGVVPVGFADPSSLIAAVTTATGDVRLERIDLGTGGSSPLAEAAGTPDLNGAALAPDGRQLAYLDTTAAGTVEAVIANADGTGPVPLAPPAGGLTPVAVSFGR